jgi:hypothetical protein
MKLSKEPNLFVPGHLRPTARLQRYPLRQLKLITTAVMIRVLMMVVLSGRRVTLPVSRNTTRTAARQQSQRRAHKQDDDGGPAVFAGVDYSMHTVSHRQDGEDAGDECYQGAHERRGERPSSV